MDVQRRKGGAGHRGVAHSRRLRGRPRDGFHDRRFVADKRAPTPSAAAEMAVPDKRAAALALASTVRTASRRHAAPPRTREHVFICWKAVRCWHGPRSCSGSTVSGWMRRNWTPGGRSMTWWNGGLGRWRPRWANWTPSARWPRWHGGTRSPAAPTAARWCGAAARSHRAIRAGAPARRRADRRRGPVRPRRISSSKGREVERGTRRRRAAVEGGQAS